MKKHKTFPPRRLETKKKMILPPTWMAMDRDGPEEYKTPLPRRRQKEKKMALSPTLTAIN